MRSMTHSRDPRRRRRHLGRRPAARDGRARRRRGSSGRRCCGTTPVLRRTPRISSPTSAARRRGPMPWAVVPVASFTVTKVRWLARVEPENARRTARVMLPHDYLTWALAGRPDEGGTDRGDASGRATGRPAPAIPRRPAASWPWVTTQCCRGAGPGRAARRNGGRSAGRAWNRRQHGRGPRASALVPGDVIVSLGTSGTAFAVSTRADGRCERPGSRLRRRDRPLPAARLHVECCARPDDGGGHASGRGLRRAGCAGDVRRSREPAGSSLLPYLDGERTPNLPDARARCTESLARTSARRISRAPRSRACSAGSPTPSMR